MGGHFFDLDKDSRTKKRLHEAPSDYEEGARCPADVI